MYDSFAEQLEASDVLRARWQPIYNAIADEVEAETGGRPTPEDVYPMLCVRTAVFANTDDWTAWRSEAALIPAIAKAKEAQRFKNALTDQTSPEAQKLAEKLASMSPASRLAYARSHGLTGVAETQAQARGEGRSEQETIALTKQAMAMPAGMRLAFCRKHGLG